MKNVQHIERETNSSHELNFHPERPDIPELVNLSDEDRELVQDHNAECEVWYQSSISMANRIDMAMKSPLSLTANELNSLQHEVQIHKLSSAQELVTLCIQREEIVANLSAGISENQKILNEELFAAKKELRDKLAALNVNKDNYGGNPHQFDSYLGNNPEVKPLTARAGHAKQDYNRSKDFPRLAETSTRMAKDRLNEIVASRLRSAVVTA